MKGTRIVAMAAILAYPCLAGAQGTPRIAERLRAEGAFSRCTKVLILGITQDAVVRREFEDRFVSILKGRGVAGLPSWKISEGLGAEADKEQILIALTGSGVDAVLTVRPVPLGKEEPEEAWASAWKTAWSQPMTIRQLIDQTLPL